jgi:hypothetical protein
VAVKDKPLYNIFINMIYQNQEPEDAYTQDKICSFKTKIFLLKIWSNLFGRQLQKNLRRRIKSVKADY